MYYKVKCLLDRFFALLSLILFSPLLLLGVILVALDGKGNIIFGQERLGQGGKPFKTLKFRTMDSISVPFDLDKSISAPSENRITRVGKFLRKSKIDELPQLVNILKGEMSFIGPRPLLADFDKRFEGWERKKYQVKPGLSGLAQIKGGAYLSIKGRSLYDVYYAENLSFSLDCKIFFKTFAVLLKGEKGCIQEPEEGKIKP